MVAMPSLRFPSELGYMYLFTKDPSCIYHAFLEIPPALLEE